MASTRQERYPYNVWLLLVKSDIPIGISIQRIIPAYYLHSAGSIFIAWFFGCSYLRTFASNFSRKKKRMMIEEKINCWWQNRSEDEPEATKHEGLRPLNKSLS